MKTWRRRWVDEDGTLIVRYIGMFRCLCGGKWPYIDLMWDDTVIGKWPSLSFAEKRSLVRRRRRDTLNTLQTFVETSELCHDETKPGEKHGITVSE